MTLYLYHVAPSVSQRGAHKRHAWILEDVCPNLNYVEPTMQWHGQHAWTEAQECDVDKETFAYHGIQEKRRIYVTFESYQDALAYCTSHNLCPIIHEPNAPTSKDLFTEKVRSSYEENFTKNYRA